jgi:2-methylcitrate dehydratase PrpD
MGKVSCILDPALDKAFPAKWPSTIEITTNDGRIFSTRIDSPKGDYDNPLSWDELIEKFNSLATIYSKERRKQIESAVSSLGTGVNGLSNLETLLVNNGNA